MQCLRIFFSSFSLNSDESMYELDAYMCLEKTDEYCKLHLVSLNVYKGYRSGKCISLWNFNYRINISIFFFITIAVSCLVCLWNLLFLVGWKAVVTNGINFPHNNCLHQTVADVIFISPKNKCQPIESCRYKNGQCHLQPQIACDIYKWAILRLTTCINDEL